MLTETDLKKILQRIDRKGYKAYKELEGSYQFSDFHLFIDHVQGDPFASLTKIRLRVDQTGACIPAELFKNKIRRIALQDFLARQVQEAIRRFVRGRRGTGKSGMIAIDAGGQEVLERTTLLVTPQWVEARLQIGLPAQGRSILSRQAEQMLCGEIPKIVQNSLLWAALPQNDVRDFVCCVENQEAIRQQLQSLGLVAFVADDSILPRESGASDRPMARDRAVPFQSPQSLQVTLQLPNPIKREGQTVHNITGMGIPAGVTLIVGGGYHGKSTLLKALERGVYPHIPGDGREYVVTLPDAVKIRAEDGRRVEQVDISPFITNLPFGQNTKSFCTDDASGSTSQAANIMEALEAGARLLLVDEDTSATNFMVRDARMQALVHKQFEPITPFLDRVRQLYESLGVSTILVMGGCGDYLDVADTVIMMRNYLPVDITEEARKVAQSLPTRRRQEVSSDFSLKVSRIPLPESFDPSRGKQPIKIDAKALDLILFGTDPIDLRYVEQLVDISQTRAVGYAINLACKKFIDGRIPLPEILDALENYLNEHGLDVLDPFRRGEQHPGNFARPRRFEIAAAINRLRTLRMHQTGVEK